MAASRRRAAWSARITDEQAAHLGLAELAQDAAETLAMVLLERARHFEPGLGQVDQDDPSIGRIVAAFDHAPLGHSADDAGGAGHRNVESLGQAAHGDRTFCLEHAQHVQVDQAERAAMPAPIGIHLLARGRHELLEERIDQTPTPFDLGQLALFCADS